MMKGLYKFCVLGGVFRLKCFARMLVGLMSIGWAVQSFAELPRQTLQPSEEACVISSGVAYFIESPKVGEVQEYTLTTEGKAIELSAPLVVKANAGATVKLRLKKAKLFLRVNENYAETPGQCVLQIQGGGRVELVAEEGENILRSVSANGSVALIAMGAGELVFRGNEDASLWVCGSNSSTVAFGAVEASAKDVCVASGTIHFWSAGSGGVEPCIPPVLTAKTFKQTGGECRVGFYWVNKASKITFAPIIQAETIALKGGALAPINGYVGAAYEVASDTTVVGSKPSRYYGFPQEAFEKFSANVASGRLGNKVYFPIVRGMSEGALAKCFVYSETEPVPLSAVSVDTTRNVASVEVKLGQREVDTVVPKPIYATEQDRARVEVFQAPVTVEGEKLRANLDFGLSWIGSCPSEHNGVLQVAVQVAVCLPNETEPERTFSISVKRRSDETSPSITVFHGNVTFSRSNDEGLYTTHRFLLDDAFDALPLATNRYQITASRPLEDE